MSSFIIIEMPFIRINLIYKIMNLMIAMDILTQDVLVHAAYDDDFSLHYNYEKLEN